VAAPLQDVIQSYIIYEDYRASLNELKATKIILISGKC
jgi:hypothetical protein